MIDKPTDDEQPSPLAGETHRVAGNDRIFRRRRPL